MIFLEYPGHRVEKDMALIDAEWTADQVGGQPVLGRLYAHCVTAYYHRECDVRAFMPTVMGSVGLPLKAAIAFGPEHPFHPTG